MGRIFVHFRSTAGYDSKYNIIRKQKMELYIRRDFFRMSKIFDVFSKVEMIASNL